MIFIPDSVFPVNDHGQAVCPKCQRLIKECVCPTKENEKSKTAKPLSLRIRLETSGRHGKVVTLIEGLTGDENAIKNLAKILKTKTGSGGTFYRNENGGVIELQGDHKNIAKEYFKKSL